MRILNVFLKSIAQQFYKDHIGFFFVVIFIVGGFLRAEEHITIAKAVVNSWQVMLLILLLWLSYVIRSVYYVKAQLNKPVNRFLRVIAEQKLGIQMLVWSVVNSIICLPVILYGSFIIGFAISANEWLNLSILVFFITLCAVIPSLYYILLIRNFSPEKRTNYFTHWLNTRFVRPYPIWFIQYLLKEQPLTFILSKSFVIVVMSAFIAFTYSGDYDWRVVAVGVVFGLVGNLTIVDAFHRFENEKLELFRGLPLSAINRLKKWIVTFTLLILPEIIILTRHFPLVQGVDKLAGLILLIITFPIATMSYQHMDKLDKEELIKAGFSVTMLFFFLTMFSVHPVILAVLCCVLTTGILFKYYNYVSG